MVDLNQGCLILLLEGQFPTEFSSIPNESHLNQIIKFFRITGNFQASVLRQIEAKLCRTLTTISFPVFPHPLISDRTDSPQDVRKFNKTLLSHVLITATAEMLLCTPERESYEAVLKMCCVVIFYLVLFRAVFAVVVWILQQFLRWTGGMNP